MTLLASYFFNPWSFSTKLSVGSEHKGSILAYFPMMVRAARPRLILIQRVRFVDQMKNHLSLEAVTFSSYSTHKWIRDSEVLKYSISSKVWALVCEQPDKFEPKAISLAGAAGNMTFNSIENVIHIDILRIGFYCSHETGSMSYGEVDCDLLLRRVIFV